jgi:hypothetical protein
MNGRARGTNIYKLSKKGETTNCVTFHVAILRVPLRVNTGLFLLESEEHTLPFTGNICS